MQNLHELPRFADKLSYLYVEHAVVDKQDKAVAVHDAEGVTPVPAASLAMLVLGPGTKITHAAVRALADNNCQLLFSGEQGVRLYAHGLGGSRHSRNLIRQARLVSDELTRLQVVIRMYCLRFDEPIGPERTLQQLRGMEGIRVREAYRRASEQFGVAWHGRSYKRNRWSAADPVNRALSAANACLYGLVHAAILSGGYSPALGFIHTGKQLSFVYDVADLYKAEITIPIAFRAASECREHIERSVRYMCRDLFRTSRFVQQILPDIEHCLDVEEAAPDEFAVDPAKPSALWNPTVLTNETPIGKVLKLDPASLPRPMRSNRDDRDDSGTSGDFAAG